MIKEVGSKLAVLFYQNSKPENMAASDIHAFVIWFMLLVGILKLLGGKIAIGKIEFFVLSILHKR